MSLIDWSDPDEMLGLLLEFIDDEAATSHDDRDRGRFLNELSRELRGLALSTATADRMQVSLREIIDSRPRDFVNDPVMEHLEACIEELQRIDAVNRAQAASATRRPASTLGDGMPDLLEVLTRAAAGRGVAGAAVITRAGAGLRAQWVPESDREPAFLAYSITKTFIAVLILGLCEEGRLDLDDPIARWFTGVPDSHRISIRQLLNHTAGIPDYGTIAAYHAELESAPSIPWSFDRFARETFEKGLSFEPGRGWAYSNAGYMLLERIMEEATGTSFRTLIAERIVRPLRLRRTFVAETIDDLASLAAGMSRALSPERTPRDVRAHYHPGWVSHGVVASTASELAVFLDGLFQGGLLQAASVKRMMDWISVPEQAAPDPALRRGKPSYGLGLMAYASPWGLVVGHNGGGPCYSASAFHALDLGGASVSAMGAIEDGFNAEGIVFDLFGRMAARRGEPPIPSDRA